jgi:hypothetical protein
MRIKNPGVFTGGRENCLFVVQAGFIDPFTSSGDPPPSCTAIDPEVVWGEAVSEPQAPTSVPVP